MISRHTRIVAIVATSLLAGNSTAASATTLTPENAFANDAADYGHSGNVKRSNRLRSYNGANPTPNTAESQNARKQKSQAEVHS